MTRFFAIAALALAPAAAQAEDLLAQFVPSANVGVDTFDPITFGPGPVTDFWNLVVSNPNTGNATSIELDLAIPGLLDLGQVEFKDSPEPAMLGPNLVADSFFTIPTGSTVLVGEARFADGVLGASYTVSGDTSFVDADGGEAILAVAAVPTGTFAPFDVFPAGTVIGRASIDGVFQNITIIPEPATVVLAGLALVGFASRRK